MTLPDSTDPSIPRALRRSRLREIPYSSIRKVRGRANQLEAAGKEVFHLEVGEPDLDTPTIITEAAVEALRAGKTRYSDNAGIPALRSAIARKLEQDNGIRYEADKEIVVTAGASEAVLITCLALLEPGDEIIVVEPAWPHYRSCALLCRASPVVVPTTAESLFLPDPAAVQAAVTPRTKAIVLNSPNNPTGVVYRRELLEQIGHVARANGLVLVSDEIYEHLQFTGSHVSTGSVQSNWPYTVTINGFSKAFAMTGWRLAYCAAPAPIAELILRAHQYNTVCSPVFVQEAGALAYAHGATITEEVHRRFQTLRDLVSEEVAKMPGIELAEPDGTFYAFPNIENTGHPASLLSQRLLDEAGVATVPGNAFGRAGEGHIRISFASDEGYLREGLQRMRHWLEANLYGMT